MMKKSTTFLNPTPKALWHSGGNMSGENLAGMMSMTREDTLPLVSAKMVALGEDKWLQDFRHHRDFYDGVSGSFSSILQDMCAVGITLWVMQNLSETPGKIDWRLVRMTSKVPASFGMDHTGLLFNRGEWTSQIKFPDMNGECVRPRGQQNMIGVVQLERENVEAF
jgi:hypothetical protein